MDSKAHEWRRRCVIYDLKGAKVQEMADYAIKHQIYSTEYHPDNEFFNYHMQNKGQIGRANSHYLTFNEVTNYNMNDMLKFIKLKEWPHLVTNES